MIGKHPSPGDNSFRTTYVMHTINMNKVSEYCQCRHTPHCHEMLKGQTEEAENVSCFSSLWELLGAFHFVWGQSQEE